MWSWSGQQGGRDKCQRRGTVGEEWRSQRRKTGNLSPEAGDGHRHRHRGAAGFPRFHARRLPGPGGQPPALGASVPFAKWGCPVFNFLYPVTMVLSLGSPGWL